MPETIVIAGGGRNVGKTRLAERLARILSDAAVIKIGVHHARPDKNELFFDRGVAFREIAKAAGAHRFMIIESGSILDDPDLDPALVIFLPAPGGDKSGSEARRSAAHIVRGERPLADQVRAVARRLGVDDRIALEVVEAAMEERITPPGP